MNEVNKNYNVSTEVTSIYPVEIDNDLELGLGLSIGCGLKKKEEASRRLTSQDLMSSCSSTSSSSVNNPNSFIVGAKRIAAIDSVSPSSTGVVGWPPIRKGHRMPILANRIKLEHDEFSKNTTNDGHRHHHHLSVKVNMDGTPIGRKVDLFAQTSYEMLAHTLEVMFYGIHKPSTDALGSSRLLNGTSEYVLTYEDKDGDCMLVGDVPWPMFLSSVKRLRILRNPNLQHSGYPINEVI